MTRIRLTRQTILDGAIHAFAREHRSDIQLMSDAERAASIDAVLSDPRAQADGFWLFGYGSLIWNPAFDFAERQVGRIHGFHRRFCMWTQLGRGCPQRPGLMLALDRGGSCAGVGYRIDAARLEAELDVVWRREMLTAAYRPTWVKLRGPRLPGGSVHAVAFVISQDSERYAGRLDEAETARHIAAAAGPLGRCCDYLFDLVEHLDDLGIPDRGMHRLARAVRAAPVQSNAADA